MTSPVSGAGGGGEVERLSHLSTKEAATAVEGVFVSMLVSEMKKTLGDGGFFGNGPGAGVFDGIFLTGVLSVLLAAGIVCLFRGSCVGVTPQELKEKK